MGRPPCCHKAGVKKGPWTPEEDLVLVSYVQENGPGNWRAVPAKTGLMRCSKSCRLRWTNYLRPGIRRGGFSEQEDRLIVHLQALLGNRWAAIASYLPDRTDNDVKNYWNTHLKKKLVLPGQQQQKPHQQQQQRDNSSHSKGKWELRLQTDIDLARRALREALSVDAAAHHPCPPPRTTTTTIVKSTAAALADEPAAAQAPQPPYVGLSACNVSVMLDAWAPPPRAAESASGSSSEHTDCSAAAGGSASSASDCPGATLAVKQDDEVPLSAIESWLLGGDDGGEQLQQLLVAHQAGLLRDAAALHSFAF